jgi:transposase
VLPGFWLVSWENGLVGYNFAGGGDGDQMFLMPPDPRDWLPAGHLAWAVRRQVRELDLTSFLAAYRADGQGNTGYHPRMMVALVMYCYCKGIRSSRAIEMATWDDVGARVICGGLHPDHATNARFVARHQEPLKGLLVQSLVACAREGLVRVDVTAGDGTKVKANASMAANADAERLGLEVAELERLLAAEAEAWIAEARAADVAEDALPGGGDHDGPPAGGGTPAGMVRRRTAGKLARRKAAQAKLEAAEQSRRQQAEAGRQDKIAKLAARKGRLEARAAAELARARAKVDRHARREAAAAAGAGRRPAGPVPAPAEQQRDARVAAQSAARAARQLDEALAAPAVAAAPDRPPRANITDPASRVMPLKKGGFDQLYNLQAFAGRRQVIFAVGTHDGTSDAAALHPLLAAAAANLAAAGIPERIGAALFDAGYASEDNFTAGCDAELYVAVARESVQAGRHGGAAPPSAQPGWQAMAARLGTPEGRALYKQRKAIIEPVFAQLFNRFGRALNYRGDLVATEIHLQAAVHNMLKAIRARARRQQHERHAAPPAPAAA